MKKTIRIMIAMLTAVLALTFTACGGGGGSSENSVAGNTYELVSNDISGIETPEFNGTRRITFNEDGTYEFVQDKMEYSNGYTLHGEYQQKGDTVTLKADPDEPDSTEAEFTLDGDNLIDAGTITDKDEDGTEHEFTWNYVYAKK